jgi:hypothetical protein
MEQLLKRLEAHSELLQQIRSSQPYVSPDKAKEQVERVALYVASHSGNR